MESAVWSMVSIIVGGLITFWASRRYYIKASEDSKEMFARILAGSKATQQGINALGRMLEAADIFEGSWDPVTHNLRGLTVKGSAHSSVGVSTRADATVVRAAENQPGEPGPAAGSPADLPTDEE